MGEFLEDIKVLLYFFMLGAVCILFMGVTAALIWGGYSLIEKNIYTCNTQEIIAIGACSKSGYCSVQYNDNSYGNEDFPIIGKKVKVCR